VGVLLDIVFFFLNLYLTKDWIDKAAKLDATAFAIYTILVLFIGLCTGAIVTRAAMGRKQQPSQPSYFDRRRMERETREREEQERIQEEESERKRRHDWVASLDANTKAMLFEIYNIKQVDLPFDSERRAREFSQSLSYMDKSAVTCTHVGYDGDRVVYRVRLSDFGMHVVEECYDTLAEAEDFHS
jgi:hypothetical protein